MPLLTPEVAGYIVGGQLVIWLALGAHIGVALGLSGFLGIYLTVGPDAAFAQLAAIPFSTTNSFTLAVIPLFILMGSFATAAGIVTELFRTAYLWLGTLRGGLAMATVMASAAFGAASGSTIVNAAVFTKMAMPEMTRFGYDVRLSSGCIAAAGTLAARRTFPLRAVVSREEGSLCIAGLSHHWRCPRFWTSSRSPFPPTTPTGASRATRPRPPITRPRSRTAGS